MPDPRTPQQVIDQAITENHFGEYLGYAFAIVFVLCGVGVLVIGAIRKDGLVAAAGGISSTLFWPSLSAAMRIRRQNVAIRLLELPMNRADTSREAAEVLRGFFEFEFISGNKK